METSRISSPGTVSGTALVLLACLVGCFDLSNLPERLTDFDPGEGTGSGDSDTDSESAPAQNGQACLANTECQSNHCVSDVCCENPGHCCGSDAVCEDGYACDLTSFACRSSCKNGSEDQDAWCQDSHHCDANTCFDDVEVGPCDEPSDCHSGECRASYCCEHAGLCCTADADCPELFDGCATDNTRTCVFSVQTLPDTGQSQCRDVTGALAECSGIAPGMDYYGQDGHYPRDLRSFTDLGDGRVRDDVTQTQWAKAVGPTGRWSAAQAHCHGLTLGANTFRLPSRFELLGLLDFSSTAIVGLPADFSVLPDTQLVWTGTELAGEESSTVWAVDLVAGTVLRTSKDSVLPSVLCVEE